MTLNPESQPTLVARKLADDDARRRIREDLGATLVVEAAAGTGKTTMLVARIVGVLRAGVTELDRIVAVTFTEKAAGEMKLRLRAVLEKERTAPENAVEERARLDAALEQLEVAKIGTIHALCADLLRERPVEARVDPLFTVMPEDEAERLFEVAFDRWFQETLADPPEGVRRMLRRRPRGRDRQGPRVLLRDAGWRLLGHRDFPARARRDPFDRDGAIDELIERFEVLVATYPPAEGDDDFLHQNLAKVARFLDEQRLRESVRSRDYDGLEAELAEVARWKEWKWRGRGRTYTRGVSRDEVASARTEVKKELDAFVQSSGADLAACLQQELAVLDGRYAALKRRAGKLDFLDLLLGARDLVRDHPAVRAELQARTSHLFVDEFQDTDPLQAEILLLLASGDSSEVSWLDAKPVPGKLFLVGDPKQSIYRFRRADVALYQAVKSRLVAGGASLLHLVTSFRSAPSIQSAVNAAFAPVMKPSTEGTQAEYVALAPFRDEPQGRPTIVALSVPRPYSSWGKVTTWSVDKSSPDAVGAFVAWLVNESGFRVTEAGSEGRDVPVEARHICLLFKRFQSFGDDATRPFVRALEARRIPHVLVGGRSFHDREEVQAVVNALFAIEWPSDELSVYATLRGPFFALSDDALLAYKHGFGQLSPLRRVEMTAENDDLEKPVADALAILRRLHLGRNKRPIADTVAQLLEATRAHAGIANWPTGEQSLANVLRVMDLARRFETSGATSFRGFVDRLAKDAEEGSAGEAPVVEEGTDGVRIMTVHRAKGLEFPVVVLADPTTPTLQGNPPTPSRYVDPAIGLWAEPIAGLVPAELVDQSAHVLERDREEAVRLAYVATTRARDLLVVPACGDEPIEGWLDVLNPVLYPPRQAWREAIQAPGCPVFGEDSVLERPSTVQRDGWSSVMPGAHRPTAGEHTVVWWDPHVLDLDRESEGGLRQQRILVADEHHTMSFEGASAHVAWRARRDEVGVAGAIPTLATRTATAIAQDESAAPDADVVRIASEIELEHTSASLGGRPHGKRFGALVHAVLAEIDFDKPSEHVKTVAIAQGRLAGATPEEIDAAAEAAIAALEHPLMIRAANAARLGACRREVPVLLPRADNSMVEGVVDLAFRGEDGSWVVVDFKTDAELGQERRAAYERQLALYVLAIASATGQTTRGVLLSI